uniref:Uncharacterized protein n=1 Tax=Anguilla anguilla TaxID=7936 RepID=A0A0E9W8C2_ANGAN
MPTKGTPFQQQILWPRCWGLPNGWALGC